MNNKNGLNSLQLCICVYNSNNQVVKPSILEGMKKCGRGWIKGYGSSWKEQIEGGECNCILIEIYLNEYCKKTISLAS